MHAYDVGAGVPARLDATVAEGDLSVNAERSKPREGRTLP